MRCLIIAAGKGSRLRRLGDSKPLTPCLGVPLIERVIRSAQAAGADAFYVVTGHAGEAVRRFLHRLSGRLAVPITPLVNDDWEKENGLSVLAARKLLKAPFLLLMGDHLFDPALLRAAMAAPLPEDGVTLVVDRNLENPLVDKTDVTRVKMEGREIRNIGKGIADFNGYDTGIFRCGSALFSALERCGKSSGDTTLSGAIRLLAREGRAKAVPAEGFWIDVDDPAALKRAEEALLTRLREKPTDGPVSRHLNRPLSVMISRRLVNHAVTPNQISLFSFVCSLAAAGLFVVEGVMPLRIGGALAQFASVIDGCDGEVARLKYQATPFGGWFDAVLDRYADAFLLFGLTWRLMAQNISGWVLFTGVMAIIGTFMVSYTADKHDRWLRERVERGRRAALRIGRDSRIFLIFLGAVTNWVFPVLAVIAVAMNLETLRRIWIAGRDR